jgi:tetratricopeptide (TPR) repeat protein
VLTAPAAAAPQHDWDDCRARDPDRAVAACTRILQGRGETALKRAEAYNARANAFAHKGEYDRAIADLNEAIRLDPKNAHAFSNRGIAWRHKGDFERAVADYDEAIRLDPREPDYWNNRCWARATANRDLQQALADCNEALRLKPDEANTMDSRAFVYLRLDRLDEAIADYDAVLKINPKLPASLYGRGLARLRKGDTANGDADVGAAKAMQAGVAEEFARYGVEATSKRVGNAVPSAAAPALPAASPSPPVIAPPVAPAKPGTKPHAEEWIE